MDRVFRVLVVDDDPMTIKYLSARLEQMGCACRIARSHRRALDLLGLDDQLHLVLLDHGAAEGRISDFVEPSPRETQQPSKAH